MRDYDVILLVSVMREALRPYKYYASKKAALKQCSHNGKREWTSVI